MVEGLSELTTACAATRRETPGERITRGEEHWFIGHAASSAAGTVALAQNEAIKIVFRDEDIREVRKLGDRFVVRVRADADMLISHERVVKAAPTQAGCCGHGGDDSGRIPTVIRDTVGSRVDPTADVNFIEDSGCWWQINCYTINIPFYGPARVCIPVGYRCS